ncbi:hypothetical protein Ancab_017319 [Ancistrocladus abbreviatus]
MEQHSQRGRMLGRCSMLLVLAIHSVQLILGFKVEAGVKTTEVEYVDKSTGVEHEVRCLRRKLLDETLSNELPSGTIRFSSQLVSIEESGHLKLLHLADGTTIKTKVLIGCDGVNSEVAKWLGFKKATFDARCAIRGYAVYKEVKELEENPLKMKEFVLSKLGKLPDNIKDVFGRTKVDDLVCSPLRYRAPWEILWADISTDNVCVSGDACHPMTPDLGQGFCSALEDGVVLAKCLAEAFARSSTGEKCSQEEEYERIKMSLSKYAKERRWRAFDLVSTAYMVGHLQFTTENVISFLRNKFLAPHMVTMLMKKATYDCGMLKAST